MPGGRVILVVEDELEVRELVAEILAEEGYEVLQAGNGIEALAVLKARPIDLLFTDLVMPGMDGFALAREAKRLFPSLKILYTSGYMKNVPLAPDALDGGRLLAKPWRPSALCDEIASALSA